MSTPKRIKLSRRKGYRKPVGAVVVSRPSRWGSPFKIGDPHPDHGRPMTAYASVKQFTLFLQNCVTGQWMAAAALEELPGKDVACWCDLCAVHASGKPVGVDCKDCAPCHGDVLLVQANPT